MKNFDDFLQPFSDNEDEDSIEIFASYADSLAPVLSAVTRVANIYTSSLQEYQKTYESLLTPVLEAQRHINTILSVFAEVWDKCQPVIPDIAKMYKDIAEIVGDNPMSSIIDAFGTYEIPVQSPDIPFDSDLFIDDLKNTFKDVCKEQNTTPTNTSNDEEISQIVELHINNPPDEKLLSRTTLAQFLLLYVLGKCLDAGVDFVQDYDFSEFVNFIRQLISDAFS